MLHADGVVAKEPASCSTSGEAKDDNGITALLRAASNIDRREVKKLILDGADPSVADGQGLTALHYAAILGSRDLAGTLIEHGPAELVYREAPDEKTCLFLACAAGHLEVVRMLVTAGGSDRAIKGILR